MLLQKKMRFSNVYSETNIKDAICTSAVICAPCSVFGNIILSACFPFYLNSTVCFIVKSLFLPSLSVNKASAHKAAFICDPLLAVVDDVSSL